ncbi:glycerophosphodiester phosphodiesterase [Streptomyces johnsoniae]|uniref:Glycerophosphodiester phosphodiesterase family protein n=1 Tax=Streptomyces johnsoniae TaxID=3075532 RepID=A0ABU2S848_9ACTN|nr:glycerophosphodiester phosphodiesterase family protein [Streptomyces sp. DSM 41886]MDT0444014.1 glycerophosphodiester phosphodiesterase family protein [Streptomyces sp. DSM 41886]
MKKQVWRATAVAAFGCLALTLAPAAAQADEGNEGNAGNEGPAVLAHRGSSGMAPENTAAATDLAIAQGADFVEIDVQRTKDGRLVNFHDCTMERTTNVEEVYPGRSSYRVSDFTWAQLRRLDAGSWFHENFAGERIITVNDVIRRVDRSNGATGLLAEISPCAHYEGLADDLAETLWGKPRFTERALAAGRLGVQSFELDDAQAFHGLMPEVPIGFLTAERPTEEELVTLGTWADQVNPQYTVTDQELVDRVHELGMAINVWTVNEPGAMRTMAGLGVDGIITDYPQSLTQR